jgi:invasion protein IalB
MQRYSVALASAVALAAVMAGIVAAAGQDQPASRGPVRQVIAQGDKKTAAQPQVAAAAPAAPADQAKPSASAPSGANWRVECSGDGKVLDCRAVQQVVLRDTQQLVAGLAIRVPVETKKPVMMIQMPLGILVSEAVEFAVDDAKAERFPVQTCNQQGCFVGTPLADNLLAAMRSGRQIRIVFQNSNKQAITVTLPLAGFVVAYDKVRS